MKQKDTAFDMLIKVSELRMDVDTAIKRIKRLHHVSASLMNDKAVEYAKEIYKDAYSDPCYAPDVCQSIVDFKRGYEEAINQIVNGMIYKSIAFNDECVLDEYVANDTIKPFCIKCGGVKTNKDSCVCKKCWVDAYK